MSQNYQVYEGEGNSVQNELKTNQLNNLNNDWNGIIRSV